MLKVKTISIVPLLAALAMPLAWADTALESIATYEAPQGVIRSAIRNSSEEACKIGAPQILRADGQTLPVYWAMSEPEQIAPGDCGFITFMPNAAVQDSSYQASTEGGPIPLAAISSPPLIITYAVFQDRQLYVYVTNPSGEPHTVTGLQVGVQRLQLESPVRFSAGSGDVLVAACEPEGLNGGAVPSVCVTVELDSGELVPLFARLFKIEHTVMQGSDGAGDVAACLSHIPPSIEEGAATAIPLIHAKHNQVRTLKFCNMDLLSSNNGPYYFAQLTERNHIEPQLGYSGDVDTPAYLGKLLGELEKIKERTAPGMFYLWLFSRDNHAAGKPRYSVSHIRNTAYTSLAAGSKGIEFYSFEKAGMEASVLAGIEGLQSELKGLRSLIANSEPMPGVEGSTESVAVRALRCGDRGVLLSFIPVLLAEGESPQEATIVFESSMPLSSRAVELGGAGDDLLVEERDGAWSASASVEGDVRVFFVPAEPEGES